MSQNLPSWGKDLDKDDAVEMGLTADTGDTHNDETAERSNKPSAWPRRPNFAPLPNRSRTPQAHSAIDDAQEALGALLDTRPHRAAATPNVITPRGATRNETRGRIAGPNPQPQQASPSDRDLITAFLASGRDIDGEENRSLAIRGTQPLAAPAPARNPKDTRPHERLREKATGQYRAIRERAEMLVGPVEGSDEPTAQYARRAAAQWATRYATHVVIVLVVGALVAFGGLKSLTAQSAIEGTLRAVSAEGENERVASNEDFNSPEFEVTLPRTELNPADLALTEETADRSLAALVRQHTVAEGDTVRSIAAAYNVMPETVMGSNKIYSEDEELKAGAVLTIPPVDGMYYVAAEGDTVETIARRFSVEPAAITNYAANDLAGGQISAGKALLVPGGMMPQRYEVLVYTVVPGDSLRDIAARYGVDVPTLIVSNDIPDPDNLRIGAELRVLPVAGAEYTVKEGDTLQTIASNMGVEPDAITSYQFNRIEASSTLQPGQALMVPGAKVDWESRISAAGGGRAGSTVRDSQRPPEVRVTTNKSNTSSTTKSSTKSNTKSSTKSNTNTANTQKAVTKPAAKPAAKVDPPVKKEAAKPAPKTQPKAAPKNTNTTPKVGTGRMVWPVRGRITQYFSGRHNGLDIAINAGTPIVAADSGKVIWSGWRRDGLGYAVIIDHMNGLTTIYGHMIRQPPVYVGQYVSRGQYIGNIGSTGRSTGPHIHFMVKSGGGASYRNPLAYLGR